MSSDQFFLAGSRARAHGLLRMVALSRHRLAGSRFNWAPSHCLPLGSGRGNLAH